VAAQRLTHALKGVCGALGANQVHHVAETLDNALRRGLDAEADQAEDVSALLEELNAVHAALIASLATLAADASAQGGAAPTAELDVQTVLALIEKLAALVAKNSPSAEDQALALRDQLPASELREIADALVGAIEVFDFERAALSLDRIRSALKEKS
jgi:HPt (histidine-containing phosphotransfer) domain-containing protein